MKKSNQMVMQTDWFRTLLDYVNLDDVEIKNSPGKSLAPLFKGDPLRDSFDAVFYEKEEMRAVCNE